MEASITIPTQHLIDYNQSALAKRGGPIDEIASFNIKKVASEFKREILEEIRPKNPMLEEFEKQCKIEEWCSIIDYKFESDLEWFLRIEEKDNIEEISYEELEEFNLDSSQYLNQEFCLSQLEKKHKKSKANHKEKLDELIQLAETTQIIGEDPIKHWERNKILAHLDIKNSDFNIRTQKIEYTPTYREEFEKQVEKLLKLEVIRDSNSRHKLSGKCLTDCFSPFSFSFVEYASVLSYAPVLNGVVILSLIFLMIGHLRVPL